MKKKSLKLIIFLFMLLIIPINVKADEKVKFSITKDQDNLKPGATFTVTVKSTGASDSLTIGGYKLQISFDSNRLEYAGGASSSLSDISNNGNTITINSKAWGNPPTQNGDFEVGKFNMKVKDGAPSGSSNLNLTINDCTFDEESDSSKCDSNGATFTVAGYGVDATLSSLRIPNTTLSPAFSPSVTSYKATVTDVKEVTVNATATDSNAKVQITDNYKNLQKGDNKIDIVVTSEDGNVTKTYNIVVTLNITPTEEELLKANAKLKSLVVKGYELDFSQDEKKYYLSVPYKTTSINVTAKGVNEKAKVEIDGNKKLIVGKNTVKITVTSEDTKNKEIYQILVTRQEQKKKVVPTCPNVTTKTEWIIFYAGILGTFTLGIVLGYILCKKDVLNKIFKKREKKEEPVVVDTLSDTIDLDKTVKEIKNSNKKA